MATDAPALVWGSALEGLFLRALKDTMTPQLKAELKAAGLNLDAKIEPAYPAASAEQWIELAARRQFPGFTHEEAMQRMGGLFFEGWQQTLLGKATAALLKVIGPTSALKRMNRNFRTGDNFTEAQFHENGPGDVVLRFSRMLAGPEYTRGIIQAGGRLTGAHDLSISIESQNPPAAVLRIRWNPGK